jgi:L-phenylalanine/L-methionine N-acetyltransferase
MDALEIRHAGTADAEAIRALYAEPSVYAATLQLPDPPAALWQQRLEQPREGAYSLVACRGGELLGQIGLVVGDNPRRKHSAHIGMGVRGSARRNGVGGALLGAAVELAEQWLALRRIELIVYTDNAAAIALYRKHGFSAEGVLRRYAFRNGQYVDAQMMARLGGAP